MMFIWRKVNNMRARDGIATIAERGRLQGSLRVTIPTATMGSVRGTVLCQGARVKAGSRCLRADSTVRLSLRKH